MQLILCLVFPSLWFEHQKLVGNVLSPAWLCVWHVWERQQTSNPWLGCEALDPLLQEVHQPILQESLWLAFGELDPVV